MPLLSLVASDFIPTSSLTGGEAPTVLRGANAVIRAASGRARIESYPGHKDLAEDYNIATELLTGTIAYTTGSQNVTGTATLFLTELHIGQIIVSASGEPFCVQSITDDTHFVSDRPATTTASSQSANYLPVLFETNKKRGVLRRGNAITVDKKDILMVGDGELRLNGTATGFTATRQPKRLQRATDGTYTEFPIGFPLAPAKPAITATTGGTKGMQAGNYSFMFSWYNSVTKGFSNPCAVIKQDGTSTDLVINVGGRFQADFTVPLAAKPANADAFIVWGSQSGSGVAVVNASNFNQGAWLKCAIILIADLDVNKKAYFEYLDAEMGAVASGDNDQPPECKWLTEFANTVHYVSALGRVTATNDLGTSPGNYVLPTKATNREAAPSDWRVSVGDEITGFANGVGRLFCLTPTSVPFVTPTGKTELARLSPTLLDFPFTSRPFWTKGGISPYNIEVVQGDVFVYTGRTILRSPSNADINVVPFEIGLPVGDLTASWYDGFSFLKHSPKNQQLCVISAATKKNTQGYWISEILPYSLQKNQWQPIITVSSPTRDMIVSGVATVNGRMEFLAGGRVAGGAKTVSTFRYDEASGNPVPYYIAFQPLDNGEEARSKQIKSIRATGRMTSPQVQIHGATWNGNISIDDIENGLNSLTTITLPTSAGIQRQLSVRHLVKNLQLWALRFSGTYAGSGPVDRLDEIVVEVESGGIKQ